MGKAKIKEKAENGSKVTKPANPMLIKNVYKPLPRFNSGCKNC